ncbi:V-type ATP synthase subunit D [Hamadaea sp. NPDC050747]|uniref:V-type ATP synthase subunit D n=1 Tax=Hamadaea sp. NPDC050747 TaxID=3155789 RepID=UPI0033C686B4
MAELRGLPPGRAGRLWLRQRLAVARRGAELLDRKLRVLRSEQARLHALVTATEHDWTQAYAEATRWLTRAALIGGERAIRLSSPSDSAHVEFGWQAVMGVRYPGSAVVRPPFSDHSPRASGTSALGVAAAAYAEAVNAGAALAATQSAAAIVDGEVAATVQRLRAIRDHWIRRLDAAMTIVGQRLEEIERDESIRLRWAARRHETPH